MSRMQLAIRIEADDIDPSEIDVEHLEEGISAATTSLAFDVFKPLGANDNPALDAWDAFLTDVTKDIAPKVHGMILEAIREGLPFTWEAER